MEIILQYLIETKKNDSGMPNKHLLLAGQIWGQYDLIIDMNTF